MSSYVRKTDSVLAADDTKETLKRKLYATQQCMDMLVRACHSFGLEVRRPSGSSTAVFFYHSGLRSCKCGRAPRILEDPLDEGTWAVFCPECALGTESKKRILDAMKDWQAGKYTEDTAMLQRALTTETMADEGAKALVDAIRAQAAEDYMVALRTGRRGDKDTEEVFPERSAHWRRLFEEKEREEA